MYRNGEANVRMLGVVYKYQGGREGVGKQNDTFKRLQSRFHMLSYERDNNHMERRIFIFFI